MPHAIPSICTLKVETHPAHLPALEGLHWARSPHTSFWEDDEQPRAFMLVVFPTEAAADAAQVEMRSALSTLLPEHSWTLSAATMRKDEWTDGWKRFFHTTRVSSRLIVHPSWEPVPGPEPGISVIHIDPGLSFGTGNHPTTRACLRLLDESFPPTPAPQRHLSFLDVGTGSGILAIAAALLGYHPVVALDTDPVATACARENASRNGVQDHIRFLVADSRDIPLGTGFDVVAANLLTPVIIQCAPALRHAIAWSTRSRLILSGILSSQYPDIHTAFQELGFTQHAVLEDDGWKSGCFRPQHPLPSDR